MRELLEKKETLAIYLFMAVAESIGLFLLICGTFHITITEIGRIASAGYVLGLGGIFFALMIIMQVSKK